MTTKQKRAGRSPSYPDLDLQEALEKAKLLWDAENRNLAPIAAIQDHWHHKPNTGPGLRAVAALKKFGLLTDQGRGNTRQGRLTESAIKIILDEREDRTERDALIRQAALSPPIHAALWERYKGNLPSDVTLRYALQSERSFSTAGANALIKEFRSTIEFAKLEGFENMAAEEGEADDRHGNETSPLDLRPPPPNPFDKPPVTQTTATQTRIVQVPLLGDAWAAVQIPYPMSEADWDQMIATLTAMKPGIVRATESPRSQQASQPAATPTELSQEARNIIDKVDSGGIPMYMNANLERIAKEHGIEVARGTKPEELVRGLRNLA